MSIREEISQLSTTRRDLRNFGLLVGGVFLALGAFALWRGAGWAPVPLILGGPLFVLGAIYPKVLRPAYILWMSLAVVMGFFMTRVILTIFFFLVITPVALFFKLFRRDELRLKLDRQATSYWIAKEYPIPDRSRFEKLF